VSTFADGTINVKITITGGGAPTTTLTSTTSKNSVAPPAPTIASGAWVNIANQLTYNVTVTGQVGSIATVVITDGGLPLPNVANGMDMLDSTGSVVIPVDASNLADGPLTMSVTLTNGAGVSFATTKTLSKDTVAPALTVNAPAYTNTGGFQPVFTGENGATVSYSISDGTTTVTGSKFFNGSSKWQPGISVASLKDGALQLTVTETDPAGNPTTVVTTVIKDTVAPAGSFTIAGTTIGGVVATTNPTIALTLSFTAASGMATAAFSTNGGSTYGASQPYAASATLTLGADGLYTIAVQVTSNAGNVATFTKQVRLDRTGPAITSSITGPTNGAYYDVGKAVALTFSASDPDGATTTAVLDGATNLTSGVAFNTETLAAGTHTIVITSRDGLGNVSTSTITLTVHATIAGMTTAVNDLRAQSKITSSTTSNQLLSYLTSAQNALTAGNNALAKSYLASFAGYAQAQAGLTIVSPNDVLLAGWANDLIGRL
jgi:hypothetical protein